jgi:hypothetical protein
VGVSRLGLPTAGSIVSYDAGVLGHQFVRHTRQEGNYNEKRPLISSSN